MAAESTSREVKASYSLDELRGLTEELRGMGIRQIKLFASQREKGDPTILATAKNSALVNALKAIKDCDGDLYVAVETCLCPYTTSGACGIHHDSGVLDMEQTLSAFAAMAVLHAKSGADAVGPASMIPDTVTACRTALDAAGYRHVGLMPHLIFRSPFYGLYREVMGTTGSNAEASRAPFHVDAQDRRAGVKAARRLVAEGADSLLLEPALFILDTIRDVRDVVDTPVGCFSVSGEYKLLTGASDGQGSVALMEFCRAAKRAGADFIATYGAREVVRSFL
jgi:porphobilinogen synthase